MHFQNELLRLLAHFIFSISRWIAALLHLLITQRWIAVLLHLLITHGYLLAQGLLGCMFFFSFLFFWYYLTQPHSLKLLAFVTQGTRKLSLVLMYFSISTYRPLPISCLVLFCSIFYTNLYAFPVNLENLDQVPFARSLTRYFNLKN